PVIARALFTSFLLLLSMAWMARDPPGDLDVRLLRRNREAALFELGRHARAALRFEVTQLVLERRPERVGLGRQPGPGLPPRVRPHLTVVRDRWLLEWASHRTERGRSR